MTEGDGHGSAHLGVDLEGGRPAEGLPLALYDESGALLASPGETGPDGTLSVSYTKREAYRALYVFGEEGTSRRPARPDWDTGISALGVRASLPAGVPALTIALYTDRTIYRPGQTVYFKGIVRSDDDARYSPPPRTLKAPMSVRHSQDKEVYSEELTSERHGDVSRRAHPGRGGGPGLLLPWGAGSESQCYGTSFQVAEYRKPDSGELSADREEYFQGQEIAASGEATYYFGGPMKGAATTWRVMTQDYFFQWKGEGYYDFVDYDLIEAWDPTDPGSGRSSGSS